MMTGIKAVLTALRLWNRSTWLKIIGPHTKYGSCFSQGGSRVESDYFFPFWISSAKIFP